MTVTMLYNKQINVKNINNYRYFCMNKNKNI